jgi:23S rRNA (cytidine1920-2'-O)/16S rRNA (cytidine1409-2'-O)-methyltransferase
MLVKPQFELQPQHIGRGGLVRPDAPVAALESAFQDAASASGLQQLAWLDSAILGADGNREFFTLLRHASATAASPYPATP